MTLITSLGCQTSPLTSWIPSHVSSSEKLALAEEMRSIAARKRAVEGLPSYINRVSWEPPPARHHMALIERLEALERGDIKRLMVFMPPGSAKSTYASIFFPAWYLGRNTGAKVIAASHTAELAESFGRRVRGIADDAEHAAIFGPAASLSTESQAAGRWSTRGGGEYYAVGVRGAVTGFRADLGILDDPVKGREEAESQSIRDKTRDWYQTDFWTRLKPGARLVLIMTRWHEDDLAGWLLEEQKRGGEQWEVLRLPMLAEDDDPLGRARGAPLWPEWFTPDMVRQAQRDTRTWAALYQQRPAPEDGDYFRREWIQYYDTVPPYLRTYGASDYAVTDGGGDYTVHVVAGVDSADRIYVLDMWREQRTPDVWIEAYLDFMDTYKPLLWGEEAGQIRKSLEPYILRRQRERRVYGARQQYASVHDKATRARAIQARMATGMVYFPRSAPWLGDFEAELLSFPAGKHDDQVDALALLGRMLDTMVGGRAPEPPKTKRDAYDLALDDDGEYSPWAQ